MCLLVAGCSAGGEEPLGTVSELLTPCLCCQPMHGVADASCVCSTQSTLSFVHCASSAGSDAHYDTACSKHAEEADASEFTRSNQFVRTLPSSSKPGQSATSETQKPIIMMIITAHLQCGHANGAPARTLGYRNSHMYAIQHMLCNACQRSQLVALLPCKRTARPHVHCKDCTHVQICTRIMACDGPCELQCTESADFACHMSRLA